MKTISLFILFIYWSIMISAPIISSDFKLSRAKSNEIRVADGSKVIR